MEEKIKDLIEKYNKKNIILRDKKEEAYHKDNDILALELLDEIIKNQEFIIELQNL